MAILALGIAGTPHTSAIGISARVSWLDDVTVGSPAGSAPTSALHRMGIPKEEMTGHGFRAMARTVLDEVLHVRPDYIEHQLSGQRMVVSMSLGM